MKKHIEHYLFFFNPIQIVAIHRLKRFLYSLILTAYKYNNHTTHKYFIQNLRIWSPACSSVEDTICPKEMVPFVRKRTPSSPTNKSVFGGRDVPRSTAVCNNMEASSSREDSPRTGIWWGWRIRAVRWQRRAPKVASCTARDRLQRACVWSGPGKWWTSPGRSLRRPNSLRRWRRCPNRTSSPATPLWPRRRQWQGQRRSSAVWAHRRPVARPVSGWFPSATISGSDGGGCRTCGRWHAGFPGSPSPDGTNPKPDNNNNNNVNMNCFEIKMGRVRKHGKQIVALLARRHANIFNGG